MRCSHLESRHINTSTKSSSYNASLTVVRLFSALNLSVMLFALLQVYRFV